MKTITISFYYKGAVIATRKTDKLMTQEGKREVTQLLSSGLIKKPENWDKYEFTESIE